MQVDEQPDRLVRASLEYANSIIDTVRIPFLVLDKDLRVISVNRSFYINFEVAEQDTIGRPFAELGNKQWAIPQLLVLLKDILPGKIVINDYEVQHKFEHIGERVMLLNTCQLRVPKKIAALIAAMARKEEVAAAGEEEEELILLSVEDITDRKRLQEELKTSEERFRRAFETSRDGLLLIHKIKGNVLNSNASAQKILGYSREGFLKKNLWELGVTRDDRGFQEMMSRLSADGVIYYENTHVRTEQGQSIDADVFLVDKTKVLQCNIRDITERKNAQEKVLLQKASLERKNVALKEIIEQVEIEKQRIKDDVAANAENLLLPALSKIRMKGGSQKYIKLLKANIESLTSSFGRKISEKGLKLTPREIEICNMIKSGLAGKDIALLLRISSLTIAKHRINIRRKLGLTRSRQNLTAVIQTL